MGFHRRKLFHPFRGSRNATMACRTNCSLIPSPLHSPVSPSLTPQRLSPLHDGYHMYQNYALQIAMIGIASTLGVITLLLTMSRILRHCYSRRYYLSRRNTPILFDIEGDSPFSDDEGPAIGHPIWFMPTVGLQQSAIDSITVCKYRKDEGLIEGTECLVCLGEFQEDENLRLLPKCSHAFHVPCIDTWLRSHKNCPLCRAPVVHDTSNGSGGGVGNGDLELVRTTEPDSGFSGQNEDTQIENLGVGAESHHIGESESSGVRVVDDDSCILCSEDGGDNGIPDKILVNSDKMNCHSSIPIGSESAVSAQEFEEEIQHLRRSVSVDSSSASMISRDVVDLHSDVESSDTDLDDDRTVSSSQGVAIAKQGSGSSTTIYKLASIGHALHKRHFSLRRSSSYNRKFIFSRLCRSHSSTLPLSTISMKEIYQPNLYVMPRSRKTIKD